MNYFLKTLPSRTILENWSLKHIQAVLGGKVNILGGHSISHSKQNKWTCTCVLFRTVSEIQLFHCTVPNCWQERDVTYCLYYRYLLFKWQSWYSLPCIIHFRKFHRQHQWTLQIAWGHGVYNEHRGTRKVQTANQDTSIGHPKRWRWPVWVKLGWRKTGAVETKSAGLCCKDRRR
jgi:hypothetical protein